MRLNDMPSSLLCIVAAFLIAGPTIATPLQTEDQMSTLENLQDVEKRCANPCGYYGQLCCASNEYCYTDSNNQAECGQSANAVTTTLTAAAGQWVYYTTTYVETDLQTVTTTFSSYVAGSTGPSCSAAQGQTACGSVCCSSGEYCAASDKCLQVGGSSGYYSSLYTVTTIITRTAASPAVGPTSQTVVTITSTGTYSGTNTVTETGANTLTETGTATTTVPYETPVGTAGIISGASTSNSNSGLSGGAIAGIVIGVIAGIIILLLLCLCCCAKGILDGFLAIFGLGPRNRRRTEEVDVYEERRHSGSGNRRTWFGTRPTRTEKVESQGGGWGGLAGVAAALGGLAVLLKLKRDRDERKQQSASGYGSESYSSDYTSSSSESSRRTRDSRRSRSRR